LGVTLSSSSNITGYQFIWLISTELFVVRNLHPCLAAALYLIFEQRKINTIVAFNFMSYKCIYNVSS